MDLRALNDKVRMQIPSFTGEARQKVEAEVIARERFLEELDKNLEVECICGLTMPRASLLTHIKQTRTPWQSNLHGLKTEANQRRKSSAESAEDQDRRKLFKFSTSDTTPLLPQPGPEYTLEQNVYEERPNTISTSDETAPREVRAKRRPKVNDPDIVEAIDQE